MRRVEMVCGGCESFMALDGDPDDGLALLSLAHRFAAAHVQCGYVTEGVPYDTVNPANEDVGRSD